jgi:hypothetical protein
MPGLTPAELVPTVSASGYVGVLNLGGTFIRELRLSKADGTYSPGHDTRFALRKQCLFYFDAVATPLTWIVQSQAKPSFLVTVP